MGKISKYSNLYDKDGKLIRSVDSVSRRLDDYTIEELENLVDELAKDETKRTEYTNSMSVLMHMYETKGNPHKNEIVNKINEYVKTKTTKAEVINALKDINITESNDSSNDSSNDIKDEEARENGSSAKRRISDTSEGTGEHGVGRDSDETNTTISTAQRLRNPGQKRLRKTCTEQQSRKVQ